MSLASRRASNSATVSSYEGSKFCIDARGGEPFGGEPFGGKPFGGSPLEKPFGGSPLWEARWGKPFGEAHPAAQSEGMYRHAGVGRRGVHHAEFSVDSVLDDMGGAGFQNDCFRFAIPARR